VMAFGSGNTETAHVYEYSLSQWSQRGQTLSGELFADRFGYALALSNDGATLAVGAYRNAGGGFQAGHVRVFRFSAASWTQLGQDLDGTSGDRVGYSSDSKTVAYGATGATSGGVFASGLMKVFTYSEGQGVWSRW